MNRKLLASALCAVALGGMLSSCEDGNVKRLKTEIKVAQAQAPLSAGVMGEIAGVEYDEADNSVMFTLKATPTSIDSAFVASHTELCLPIAKVALNRDIQAEVLRQMGAAGASANIGYGGKVMMTIPADSIQAMLASPLTGRQAGMAELQGYAALASSHCPRQLVPGAELTGVEVTDSVVRYDVVLDGKTLTMASLKASTAEMRHSIWELMKAEAATADGRSFFKTAFDNNLNVDYVFTADGGKLKETLSYPYKEVYFLIK